MDKELVGFRSTNVKIKLIIPTVYLNNALAKILF